MLRKIKYIFAGSLGLLSILSCTAYAQPPEESYVVIAPQCLLKNLTAQHELLSANKEFSLLKINESGLNQLIAAKTNQKVVCGGFVNVTDDWQRNKNFSATAFLTQHTLITANKINAEYAIQYPTEVKQLLNLLNPQDMWNDLTVLSNFHDRYAKADSGAEAADWIKTQVETMVKNNNRDDVKIYTIATGGNYKQPSVIAKIGTSTDPGIVIGGHMDTLSGIFNNMPGADDDGTGSVTVLEVARTILSSGMHFKKPIYLIWYSAEEEGLIGSQHVVRDFKTNNIPVDAVMHFDMTGYAAKNDPTMWLIDDYTHPELTEYLATLIDAYVKEPIKHTRCGYACSDHATWTQNGYNAAIAFEAAFESYDPYIHTANDTMEKLSLSHMTDFAKLGVAFAVELAEPVSSK